jgi:hypothetical protein
MTTIEMGGKRKHHTRFKLNAELFLSLSLSHFLLVAHTTGLEGKGVTQALEGGEGEGIKKEISFEEQKSLPQEQEGG